MSIDFFVLSFLRKAPFSQSWWRKRAPKTRTLNEKERMKKEDEKARTESFIFPSKQKERKTTYSYKREYNTTCALSNALFRRRRRRERSERGFFILVKRNKEVLLAYARLGVLCSRERERETFAFVVEKSSPISEAAASSSSSSNLLSITSSSARTFKKRREK